MCVRDLSEVEPLSLLHDLERDPVVVLFVATWEEGKVCYDARPFVDWLVDGKSDVVSCFRNRRVAVCGLGR